MNTLNKLLTRWGYQINKTDEIAEALSNQKRIGDYDELQAEVFSLREQTKELKRKLACKTAGEYYWRKQAKEARG